MTELIADHDYILTFWFGEEQGDAQVAEQQSSLWWGKSEQTDQLIWAKFEHRIQQAVARDLLDWLPLPQGRLASILLIDQFCRNIYRGKPEAFAHDPLALQWAREGIDSGVQRELRAIERVFLYMPLEHSESLEDQQQCVALFQQLLDEVDNSAKPAFENFLQFAQRHHEVIQRFGRFPHRNAILGRDSTLEELAFLEQPGSSF